MAKILSFIFFIFLQISIYAQDSVALQIAFINSNELLEAMPEKVKATNEINDLNNKYKEELKVMQNDYNKKYTDFISYQNSMAENIRLRRMQELYELEQHIEKFMKVAQDDVKLRESELIIPLRVKLKEAIYEVGVEKGFTCIYDLADRAIAFLTPQAVDANQMVKQKLGVK